MIDYSELTTETFDRVLRDKVAGLSVASILTIPGIYEVLSAYLYNDVLEEWENTLEYRQQAINPMFGGWTLDTVSIPTVYDDINDLVQDLKDTYAVVIELGNGQLPEGCADIRAQLDKQPDCVFAYQDNAGDDWSYVGVSHASSKY